MPEKVTAIILGKLPEGQSMCKVLDAILRVCPVPVIAAYTLDALAAELGGSDAAGKWLVDKATELDKLILLHGPDPRRATGTLLFSMAIVPASPRGWSDERVAAHLGGFHEELGLLLGGDVELSTWDGRPAR